MSTSSMLCAKCGTRIATVTKNGAIRVLEGVIARLYPRDAELTCICGETRKVTYPQKKAA